MMLQGLHILAACYAAMQRIEERVAEVDERIARGEDLGPALTGEQTAALLRNRGKQP